MGGRVHDGRAARQRLCVRDDGDGVLARRDGGPVRAGLRVAAHRGEVVDCGLHPVCDCAGADFLARAAVYRVCDCRVAGWLLYRDYLPRCRGGGDAVAAEGSPRCRDWVCGGLLHGWRGRVPVYDRCHRAGQGRDGLAAYSASDAGGGLGDLVAIAVDCSG